MKEIKSVIIKSKEWNTDFQFKPLEEEEMKAITEHIEKNVGKIEGIFHEFLSDNVHIDICLIKPTEKRPYNILVTMGMSAKPMNIPKGYNFPYAELVIYLPKNWKLSQDDFKDEKNYWPIRWLKKLAVYPHACNTYIGIQHTIPNEGNPPKSFAENTKLCCMLVDAPVLTEDLFNLKLKNKTIAFWNLFPIYKEEMDYKLEKGYEELMNRFEKNNVSNVVDINRKNLCKRGLFGF
ncbi:MAG: suppressor of fused domain protein [Candidatus Pacearchaeota archaeon]|jgi:hypothetical protein